MLDVPQYPRAISMDEVRALVGRTDPLVLEIGAHDGSESAQFLAAFPGVRLHCFEPDPRPAGRHAAAITDPRCQLYRCAVAATTGTATWHQSGGAAHGRDDWDYSSSLRPPTGHLETFPWCKFERTIEVQTVALDDWTRSRELALPVDFVWADVQGAEVDLITGGRATLERHTRYLYTEFYDRPMYQGQVPLAALLALLPTYRCLAIYEGCNALLVNRALV